MYKRALGEILAGRLGEPRRFIQVLSGPRQVGKTTAVRQVLDSVNIPSHYASADDPVRHGRTWIEQQWEIARLRAKTQENTAGAILVLDEIHKIPHWSDLVKLFWDEDSARGIPLHVVLLGSAPLLMQHGLTESLAGRVELIPATHWSYDEMRTAFGWNLEQYIYYGGYPGAASLITDNERWQRYILDSLVETTIARDILLMTRVDKPALLRRLFQLGCDYSGQILSYQKMIGQLQDAGNTTTLAHYLDLLAGAGMMGAIAKFAGEKVRQRGSSPKLQVQNTALLSVHSGFSFEAAEQERDFWGRLVESAVGAHILNSIVGTNIEVFYWREGNLEVDFVLRAGRIVTAIEVKSGRQRQNLPGMAAFAKAFQPRHQWLVGGQGIPLAEFFQSPLRRYVE
jgi:predicted AAA+ superfamily ATPase